MAAPCHQEPVGSNSGAYSDVRVITSIFSATPSLATTLNAQTGGAIHSVHCSLRCVYGCGCSCPLWWAVWQRWRNSFLQLVLLTPSLRPPLASRQRGHFCALAHISPPFFTSQIYRKSAPIRCVKNHRTAKMLNHSQTQPIDFNHQ